jgi:hypothetical protein
VLTQSADGNGTFVNALYERCCRRDLVKCVLCGVRHASYSGLDHLDCANMQDAKLARITG